jgi:hypothetical protein
VGGSGWNFNRDLLGYGLGGHPRRSRCDPSPALEAHAGPVKAIPLLGDRLGLSLYLAVEAVQLVWRGGRRARGIGDLKTRALHCTPKASHAAHAGTVSIGGGRWRCLDGETRLGAADTAVAAMAGAWRRAGGAAPSTADLSLLEQGTLACLHIGTAVALVGANGTRAVGCHGTGMREGGHALEFREDGILVLEQIADQPVGVLLLHSQGSFRARSEDTGCQRRSQRSNVLLIGRCQVNQTSKVVHAGVKSSNVGQTELRQGLLEDPNAGGLRVVGRGRRINRADDLVDMRRYQGVCLRDD